MDTITNIIIPILGAVGSLVGSILGTGTLGAVVLGVVSAILLGAGMWLFNAYKKWKFKKAHEESNEQSNSDHVQVIEQNQDNSSEDEHTFDQGDKDKQSAKDKLNDDTVA